MRAYNQHTSVHDSQHDESFRATPLIKSVNPFEAFISSSVIIKVSANIKTEVTVQFLFEVRSQDKSRV